jgi:uncharacterized membrane protein YphA (DoxX/SURF4 family)
MLSLFPGLLAYQFFAITLIRVAAGITLLYISYRFAMMRGEIERTKVSFVGHIPQWLSILGALIIFAAAVLLIIGLYTQAAAIVGMLVGLKHMIYARRYPHIMPISAAAGALLFMMSLSLLFFGAGAFAFDLPL